MRMLLQVQFPAESGSRAVKDGSLGAIMEKAFADLKPEAVYFTTLGGERAGLFFLDMKNSDEMPFLAERFFSGLSAKVTLTPVMNREDLRAGLSRLG